MARSNLGRLLALCATSSLTGIAWAQDIVVKVNGAVVQTISTDNPDILVPLGHRTVDTLVQVYADEATPTRRVNSLTLSGSSAGAAIRVLVANRSVSAFPLQADLLLSSGLRDLGGISFPPDPVTGDQSLRDASLLAVAVNGDITGDITAGRIFRVQASGRTENGVALGGRIWNTAPNVNREVNITATAPDAGPSLGQLAINVITAANGIRGRIEAAKQPGYIGDVLDPAQYGSIGRVVVTPLNAEGLQADVLASGYIGSIFSTGPIGDGFTTPRIWAGERIEEIRAIDESGPVPAVLDVKADIQTGRNLRLGGLTGVPGQDAPLGALEVGGSFTGGPSAS
ncbi:MAG: hypothetical protein K2Q20_13775 [Phycisphaerales bacterium]|nr:hypothetical protein [Phycisphaerales bacterium]